MRNLILILIGFIISHIIITTITGIFFFPTYNLAIPFLMVIDCLRPLFISITQWKTADLLFQYSYIFSFFYALLMIMPLAIYRLIKPSSNNKYGR